MKRIALTSFALRHWRNDFAGTWIEGVSPAELVELCNRAIVEGALFVNGYAPFCKHLFLVNPTDTRCGFAAITEENRHLLRSGYKARREGELPVLERWLEGVEASRAKYLDIILYSREQLEEEATAHGEACDLDPTAMWGIVNIIGMLTPEELPISPATQFRNALGPTEGGSGIKINPIDYGRAV